MTQIPPNLQTELWQTDKLVFYARNPRKNDGAVDDMCASIREFGFKIAVLARSDGTIVDGHLRIKAARKLGLTHVPVMLCDEWSEAQVRAFRLLVNRIGHLGGMGRRSLSSGTIGTQGCGLRSAIDGIQPTGAR